MDTFKAYEDEFIITRTSLQRELDSYDPGSTDKTQMNKIDDLFRQANQILKEITLGLDTQTKKSVASRMAELNSSLANLKGIYDKEKLKGDKSSLMGDKSAGNRQMMMSSQAKLEAQNELILQSVRNVTIMEEEGREIGGHLQSNRAQIDAIRDKNTEMGATMDSSEQILKRMQNRDKCTVS